MKHLILISALLSPAIAVAQTTTCAESVYGMPQFGVTCRTASPSTPTECAGSTFDKVILGHCTLGEVKAANQRIADQKQIAALIADHRCDEAMAIPLKAGDLDLAQKVKDLCR